MFRPYGFEFLVLPIFKSHSESLKALQNLEWLWAIDIARHSRAEQEFQTKLVGIRNKDCKREYYIELSSVLFTRSGRSRRVLEELIVTIIAATPCDLSPEARAAGTELKYSVLELPLSTNVANWAVAHTDARTREFQIGRTRYVVHERKLEHEEAFKFAAAAIELGERVSLPP